MSDSLRDQLLKSGLVQKLRPKAPAPAAQRQPSRPGRDAAPHGKQMPRNGGKPTAAQKPAGSSKSEHVPAPHANDLARAYALRAKQEREERENAQREAERIAREKRERKQKLADLLAGKALNATEADLPRHFPHGDKIRRIYCTAEQLACLNRGELAVVQLAGRYLLVEADIARQAQSIQPECLVLLCDPNAPTDDDVPPDLVW